MLIDSRTGKPAMPRQAGGAVHYHLLLDRQSGLHHASLEPDLFNTHEHHTHQITVPFERAKGITSWHSASARHKHQEVQVGQCYVVPSGQPHGLALDRAGELVNFYLAPEFIATSIPETTEGRSLEILEFNISDDPLIRQLAATVRTDRLLHGVSNKLFLESVMNVLAVHLVNSYAVSKIKIPKVGKLPTHLLVKVQEYIEAHDTTKIAIADLANLTGYSSVHFTRMFKKATGQTPREYLMNHRTSKAKQLLVNTDLSIVEVAYESGFSSHAHFSTQFRRSIGTTPQAYRKHNEL
ncbi:MAG: AraC family transcriptional regulator [Pleurocapsa sp. MO_226.B13]|nr:AraC family transcriptional regulator [Pleurocapsa sp. MO_226.B13]